MNSHTQDKTSTGVSFVICTYRRNDSLLTTLNSFFEMNFPGEDDWELIVIDNACNAETESLVSNFILKHKQLKYITESQTGLCNARNRGLMEGRKEYIFFLDDDVSFDKDFVKNIYRNISKYRIDVIVPKIICRVDEEWPAWLKQRVSSGVGQYDEGDESKFLSSSSKIPIGAGFGFKITMVKKYGYFPDYLGRNGKSLLGGEDTLYLKRMIAGESNIRYCPDIHLEHRFLEGKESKAYWKKQAFDGGRSYVRMNYFDINFVTEFIHWLFKAASRGMLSITDINNNFLHQYHMRAYLGRIYEATRLAFDKSLVEKIKIYKEGIKADHAS